MDEVLQLFLLNCLLFNLQVLSCDTATDQQLNCDNSFVKLTKNAAFVDKTLMIKDFIENYSEIILVTFPRKWGKSVNMDMLQAFLQMDIDSEGKQVSRKTLNPFTNSRLRLDISKQKGIIDTHLQKHLVIHVSLQDVHGSTLKAILSKMGKVVGKVFENYSYMKKVFANVESNDTKKANAIHHGQLFDQIMSLGQDRKLRSAEKDLLAKSFYILSESLHEHFGQKVYVFLDEYDRPVDFSRMRSASEADLIMEFMQSFMEETFKDNKHLEKGLITGTMRVARLNTFSGVNNIVEFDMIHNLWFKYYGFTENEIDLLFEKYRIDKRLAEDAKKWYGGYGVSATGDAVDLNVYNPYSISQFLLRQNVSKYWTQSDKIEFFRYIFKLKVIESSILKLLNSESISVTLDYLSFSSEDLFILREALKDTKLEFSTADLFFQYLFVAGYLTLDKKFELDEEEAHLKLPNQEIILEITEKLAGYYRNVHKIEQLKYNNLKHEIRVLPDGNDTEKFRKSLEELFLSYPSFTNAENSNITGFHVNEDIVNSALNIVLLASKEVFLQHCEVYFQNWVENKPKIKALRPGIILTPARSKLEVVMGLQFHGSSLGALDQAKVYTALLCERKNIENIRLVGINVFPNKTVRIEQEWRTN